MTAPNAELTTITAPVMAIDPAIYSRWLLHCRRYRVSGRVVCRHWRWDGRYFRFCDDPVPNARVEISDVDCFWWFCKRDPITTVTTNPDGTFEASFWWCCPPDFPWFPGDWTIDPGLLERIRDLLREVRPRLPIPIPDPPPDPIELQPYLQRLGTALQMAEMPRAMRLAPNAIQLDEIELVKRLPAPDLEALHVWPWWPRRDCEPDIVFRVTQECLGQTEVIYSEANSQTRWNAPTDLQVTLLANDKACCIQVCEDPPCGDCFKWGEVGSTPVKNIGGNDPLVLVPADLRGLAHPGTSDIAFGRTLNISGTVGSLADFDYYEIGYSRDGSAFAPLPKKTLGTIGRIFWGQPCGGGIAQWNAVAFAPQTIQDTTLVNHDVYETRAHYEASCPGAPWENWMDPSSRWWTSNRDLALVWITATLGLGTETPQLPEMADGLYELRVVGYKLDGSGHLINPQVLRRCDTSVEERLIIRLDNRLVPDHPASTPDHPWGSGFVHVGTLDPDCDFVQFVKNEGLSDQLDVDPCDIVELADADTLTAHFLVTVPAPDNDRHLGGYSISVHHGESAIFYPTGVLADPTPHPGPTYADAIAQGETRRWWGGGYYKLVLQGSDFPETCAYLFALHAYKRVFDGSSSIEWFHSNDTEVSITIKKV
jgi:hypothetical protein